MWPYYFAGAFVLPGVFVIWSIQYRCTYTSRVVQGVGTIFADWKQFGIHATFDPGQVESPKDGIKGRPASITLTVTAQSTTGASVDLTVMTPQQAGMNPPVAYSSHGAEA